LLSLIPKGSLLEQLERKSQVETGGGGGGSWKVILQSSYVASPVSF